MLYKLLGYFQLAPITALVVAMIIFFALFSALPAVLRSNKSYPLLSIFLVFSAGIAFTNGQDASHHIFRILWLEQTIREMRWLPFVELAEDHQVVPIFFFYSTLPYLIPSVLVLFGLTAFIAYKITLFLFFLGRVDGFPQVSDFWGTRIAFYLIHRVPAHRRAGNADRNGRGGLGHGPDGV